jgi:hypothetical protein
MSLHELLKLQFFVVVGVIFCVEIFAKLALNLKNKQIFTGMEQAVLVFSCLFV